MNVALKLAIVQSGKSQLRIAKEAGVRDTRFSMILHNWVVPRPAEVTALAAVLKCSPTIFNTSTPARPRERRTVARTDRRRDRTRQHA
jgi:hypothetical protein